jgi:hypothetical protein
VFRVQRLRSKLGRIEYILGPVRRYNVENEYGLRKFNLEQRNRNI